MKLRQGKLPQSMRTEQIEEGKQRVVEPSIRLLVDDVPSKLRKASLHGYGNTIVPPVAAEFISAYREAKNEKIS